MSQITFPNLPQSWSQDNLKFSVPPPVRTILVFQKKKKIINLMPHKDKENYKFYGIPGVVNISENAYCNIKISFLFLFWGNMLALRHKVCKLKPR